MPRGALLDPPRLVLECRWVGQWVARAGGDDQAGLDLLGVDRRGGQVEADPAVLNLSPFETFYQEKRLFFIEGARFFQHPDFGFFLMRLVTNRLLPEHAEA